MPSVKAWKEGAAGEPQFASEFDVLRSAVLQVTDIKTNRNKYYAVEIHRAKGESEFPFRVYTHYGRTDDLETNPHAGMRESRYVADGAAAERLYKKIYNAKTSPSKGYKEVNLASSRIGSDKARGQSSGHIDAKTIEKMEGGGDEKKAAPKPKVSTLHPQVQDLVAYLYEEATNALTTTVQAKITANGIETPLGVLTIGQVDTGQAVLDRAWSTFQQYGDAKRTKTKARLHDELVDLTGEFFSAIPHRLGRTRAAVQQAVLDTVVEFQAKQETLQLMRDMLAVDGEHAGVLFDPEIDKKYAALGCTLEPLARSDGQYGHIKQLIEGSQIKSDRIRLQNLWRVARPAERERFDQKVGNEVLLMHGSRPKNWVGILSRGLLMPKIVVSMGVNRTDAGWLGNGIYFGNASCTSLYYAHKGRRGTRWMTVARVGLGKVKHFRKITYGLEAPPKGFDSCWGRRAQKGFASEFADDEFVIYRPEQYQMEYLAEFKG